MKNDGSIIEAKNILDLLSQKIVGQPAISGIVSTVKMYQAGLAPEDRPAGIFLLLGPTGTGKTRTVEALAEILHGDSKRVVKVNCGEYQSDHEVAKLIGSPPGYLGHNETHAALTQERLQEATSPFCDLSIVLFDEIEKAAPSVTKLLLGVLDKATLRLGNNSEVSFQKSLIFLTSNLGARAMMKELQPELGFRPTVTPDLPDVCKKLESIAVQAVKKMYSPEFVNRLDAILTYQPLDSEALGLILDQQIADLQKHVNSRLAEKCFNIEVADESRQFLLAKGTSPEFGARELKRSVHKYLTQPLATLVIEDRIQAGSTVTVLLGTDGESLRFVHSELFRGPSTPTMLIVDDNRDFLRLLSLEISETTGWAVVVGQSCAEAMTLEINGQLDFALLDLILPDGNGLELGQKLCQKHNDLRVMIMTGAELSSSEETECEASGFAAIKKPFLPQDLLTLCKKFRRSAKVSA